MILIQLAILLALVLTTIAKGSRDPQYDLLRLALFVGLACWARIHWVRFYRLFPARSELSKYGAMWLLDLGGLTCGLLCVLFVGWAVSLVGGEGYSMLGSKASKEIGESLSGGVFFRMVIATPILEELAFRGIALTLLVRLVGASWGCFGSAILFMACHDKSIIGAISVFVSGLYFALFFLRTGSLWGPMLLHSANNALTFFLVWFASSLEATEVGPVLSNQGTVSLAVLLGTLGLALGAFAALAYKKLFRLIRRDWLQESGGKVSVTI